jgi:hypothetical protein
MLIFRGTDTNISQVERDAYHPDVVPTVVSRPGCSGWIGPLPGYGGETHITKSQKGTRQEVWEMISYVKSSGGVFT